MTVQQPVKGAQKRNARRKPWEKAKLIAEKSRRAVILTPHFRRRTLVVRSTRAPANCRSRSRSSPRGEADGLRMKAPPGGELDTHGSRCRQRARVADGLEYDRARRNNLSADTVQIPSPSWFFSANFMYLSAIPCICLQIEGTICHGVLCFHRLIRIDLHI
jgi:hypothetical protein